VKPGLLNLELVYLLENIKYMNGPKIKFKVRRPGSLHTRYAHTAEDSKRLGSGNTSHEPGGASNL